MRRLVKKFQFIDDNESLRNKALFLKSAITNLLETTKECGEFIKEYFDLPYIRVFPKWTSIALQINVSF